MATLAESTINPGVELKAEEPPDRAPVNSEGPGGEMWRSPWGMVGRFAFEKPLSYYEVKRILEHWSADLESGKLTELIGLKRSMRITVEWRESRGQMAEFTLAGVEPADATIAHAIDRCGTRNRKGDLIHNYADGARDITRMTVWLGTHDYQETVDIWSPDGPRKSKSKR